MMTMVTKGGEGVYHMMTIAIKGGNHLQQQREEGGGGPGPHEYCNFLRTNFLAASPKQKRVPENRLHSFAPISFTHKLLL